jgi:hypothetical protein
MTSGFVDRWKGKTLLSASSVQQFGKGGAVTPGGGNLSGAVFTNGAAGTGNGNDTTEDLLFSYTLPANSFDSIGRQLFIQAHGTFANNANTKTAKLYFGSSINFTTVNAAGGSVIPWWMQLLVTKVGPSVQVCLAQSINGTTHAGSLDLPGTENDAAAIIIKVTGQTSVAGANNVVCKMMSVQALN